MGGSAAGMLCERERGFCMDTIRGKRKHLQRHKLRLFVQVKEAHRGLRRCRMALEMLVPFCHGLVGAAVVNPPLQAPTSSVGVTVMGLVARSNMRWMQCPLGNSGLASYHFSLFCMHTHKHTNMSRGRQKKQTQNKGIIIPYREKWSSHFPPRFRSLI